MGANKVGTSMNMYRNKNMNDYQERFKDVQIECLDCTECIKKYDTNHTLFYCDPPYLCKYGTYEYKSGWNDQKEEEFVDSIKNIKGNIVVSCYNTPTYESLKDFGFETIVYDKVVSNSNSKVATEYLYVKINDNSKLDTTNAILNI